MTGPAPDGGGTLRTRLRTETAPAHRRLEDALGIVPRLTDRGAVRDVLGSLFGFFVPAEEALDRVLGDTVMAGRHRTAALAHDLRMLGLDAASIAALPLSADAAEAKPRGEALGMLYVLEGTRLGGRVIARHLAAKTWRPLDVPRFWADGPDGERHWSNLVDLLSKEPDEDSVVRGANHTFAALLRWCEETGVTRTGLAQGGNGS